MCIRDRNKAVAEALDGLPPVKMHCSVLAEEAIHKAINDYRKNAGLSTEGWEFEETDHDELHDAVHGQMCIRDRYRSWSI